MKTKSISVFLVLILFPGVVFAESSAHTQIDILFRSLVACPPGPTRFVDNGDGTICDSQTGLMWEKIDADDGVQDYSNPRDADNRYDEPGINQTPDPYASHVSSFLGSLNGASAQTVAPSSEQLAGHNDWRLPTVAELLTIRDCSFAPTCINPIFGAHLGQYWTSTLTAADLNGNPKFNFDIWFADSFNAVDVMGVTDPLYVRAVRGGR